MSSHENLYFFNKQGDALNFRYDDTTQLFQGDILFDENSNDTFKTFALYTLERIEAFEFESPGDLGTNKFQLFNEYGLHYYGCTNSSRQQITKIEPVNNDPDFYSKWIYGEHFESKFPIGTLIVFNQSILEFTNINQTFVVTGTKKNAVLIISTVDNSTFESTYYNDYVNNSLYSGKTISGVDAIGIYNYIDTNYVNNLSPWSEPNFYDKVYKGKKLNVINSKSNDGVYTIKGPEITDIIHFEYSVNQTVLPVDSNLIIEVILGTDLPKLYDGGLNITGDNRILVSDYLHYPKVLRPGQEFKVVGSILNENFLTVADIYDFESIYSVKHYEFDEQIYYKGRLYQCIMGYTHSYVDDATKYLTPNIDTTHWSNPTYIKVNETTTIEPLLFSQLYLTKEKYYYEYGYTQSAAVTLASVAEKYKSDLSIFNIDLYYDKGYLKADLIYPSKYARVNFYHTVVDTSYSIGTEYKAFERLLEVSETLTTEFNYDYSENFKYNIVFTDLDEYGLKIIIDKQVYEEEISYVYSGIGLDMSRTIDKTLRNWLTRNYLNLYKLGLDIELSYTYIPNSGLPINSLFFNSIVVRTEYPNIPVDISDVLVGTTANYFIEHSRVLFNSMGPVLNININNKDHIVAGVTSSTLSTSTYSVVDVPKTLQSWIDLYAKDLLEYGFIVTNINSVLKFDVKKTDVSFDYTIKTGKVNLPGLSDYVITKKMKGNLGGLITSNEVILSENSTYSFEKEGFATGMVFSINNTIWPLMNVEYNIEYLDPLVLNLSYEGPFWDYNNTICDKSPFVTIAFNLGFGQTGCGAISSTGVGGQFNQYQFNDTQFNIHFYPNTYQITDYQSTTNLVDIKYIQLSNTILSYGDNLVVHDSYTGNYLITIELLGNTNSIKMEYNPVNNYVYCLSKNIVWIVDPSTNLKLTSFPLSHNAVDLQINPINGDVYITYSNYPHVHILKSTTFDGVLDADIVSPFGNTGRMAFNEFEGDMYVVTTGNWILRIDGSTRQLQPLGAYYNISGAINTIVYEPVNESIYVYGSASLYKIDNGVTSTISVTTESFNDIIFNNLTGDMTISDSSNKVKKLSLNDTITNDVTIGNHGYMAINQYDGAVYISSQNTNSVIVVDSVTSQLVFMNTLVAPTTKLCYNPDRKSMWVLQPSLNQLVEILVEIKNTITTETIKVEEVIVDNLYGTLHPSFKERDDMWLKTRDYFRRPRENFNTDYKVKYYWKWFSDNIPQFFMYDFSGEQLSRTTTGSYSYVGTTPLSTIVLNKNSNKDITKVSFPEYQQTIFDRIEYPLSYIDDELDISTDVEPLQLFVGFRSDNEGALRSLLQLYKKEEIFFTINSSETEQVYLQTLDINGPDKRGLISLGQYSIDSFIDRGLKVGQHIVIYLKDNQNTKNQYTSNNNGTILKIREVYTTEIVVDFFDITNDIIDVETSVVNGYPTTDTTTYLDFSIKVRDKEIGRFFTYGQTEEEDIRFKIELGNVGKLIAPEDVFIFKQYDIEEGGIDWLYLNRKRKEMMMMKHLIYPYIGSYKSIINAINFFGYNDLQLNEYYKNVDPSAVNFLKLFKVEIPDIFDNSVEGWTENDFIKHTMPNDNYEETNLFNLTYLITDKQGNNVLNYSLDEVIIKLQGLKYWLKKNIIPLTHKILDITGNSYFTGGTQIQHRLHDLRIVNIYDNMTPITFKLNETYLMPVNSGSTVYNCVLDFYSIIPDVGADKTKTGLVIPPTPFNGKILVLPDYFTVKIRTYKTYKEWAPFANYNLGDRVTYYGKLYESVISSNKIYSPKEYELVTTWVSGDTYDLTSIVEYNRDIYVFTKSATVSTITPYVDTINWDKITKWKEIDWSPVQTISEFRSGDNLLPFNFTLDSNIDPFVTIEVISDNGYGCIYNDKKNYEIRGLKDLTLPYQDIEPVGPFEPITLNTVTPKVIHTHNLILDTLDFINSVELP